MQSRRRRRKRARQAAGSATHLQLRDVAALQELHEARHDAGLDDLLDGRRALCGPRAGLCVSTRARRTGVVRAAVARAWRGAARARRSAARRTYGQQLAKLLGALQLQQRVLSPHALHHGRQAGQRLRAQARRRAARVSAGARHTVPLGQNNDKRRAASPRTRAELCSVPSISGSPPAPAPPHDCAAPPTLRFF
jgi:hypothetical protein